MAHLNRFRKSLYAAAIASVILNGCYEPDLSVTQPAPSTAPELPKTLPARSCSNFVINGYSNKTSYSPGEEAKVYIHAKEALQCALNIFSLSGELAFQVGASVINQVIPANASRDGFGYHLSAEFEIPGELQSGIYLIERQIPIIIKSIKPVDVLVVYPSNTANAYSTSGGQSLYTQPRPARVSFLRPIDLQPFSTGCLEWLSAQKEWSVGYLADKDLDDYNNFHNSTLLMIIGHSEYWTRTARQNFDRFIDSGNSAIILSGNTMWWQVRYTPDTDEAALICYKSFDMDPISDIALRTALWNDPRLGYPIIKSIGADFDKGGYGLRQDNGWDGFRISAPKSPLLEGTGLKRGDILRCPTTEYDGAPIKAWIDGYPELDIEAMGVTQAELIGFDKGFRVTETIGTFIVFRRTNTSGVVINAASTDWCSQLYSGYSSHARITSNAIQLLLGGQSVFSP